MCWYYKKMQSTPKAAKKHENGIEHKTVLLLNNLLKHSIHWDT